MTPKNLCRISLLAALAMESAGVQANTFTQLGLSAGNEDNVPRVINGRGERDSGFLRLDFSGGKLFQRGLNDSLTLSGNFFATRYNELGGFDSVGYGVALDWGHRFGLGAYAPRLGGVISITHENLRGEARDSDQVGVELNFQQRLSPGWFLYAGMDYQDRDGDSLGSDDRVSALGYPEAIRLPYEVYDYDSASLFANLEYTFENGLLLSGGYRRSDGSSVSSTTMPTLELYLDAEAFYYDPAFSDMPWYIYQMEADTDEWSAGLSIPLGPDSSVDFGYSWYDVDAKGNREYENSIVSVTFTRSF